MTCGNNKNRKWTLFPLPYPVLCSDITAPLNPIPSERMLPCGHRRENLNLPCYMGQASRWSFRRIITHTSTLTFPKRLPSNRRKEASSLTAGRYRRGNKQSRRSAGTSLINELCVFHATGLIGDDNDGGVCLLLRGFLSERPVTRDSQQLVHLL